MKILQIGTYDIGGGAAAISWTLKKCLEKAGYSMPMFVSEKKSDDITTRIIPKTFHKYVHYALSNDIDLSRTDWIMDTQEFKEADVIHFHNLHGWFFNLKTLQKMSKLKPTLWTLHDMWAITPHCAHAYDGKLRNGFFQCPAQSAYPRITWPNGKYLAWRKSNIYRDANIHIVVPSKWLLGKVSQSVIKDKPIDLIYNGIDETIFKKYPIFESRDIVNLPHDKKIVLFLSEGGKNNTFKGWGFVENIIQKYKEDGEVIFVCVGGDESGYDATHKNLLYVSKIEDKKTLARYFSAANIFLFPSLADNCPLVVLEAMACEVPIVTFQTGCIPELVTHLENGYIAHYKDADDLLAGVQYILKLDQREIDSISTRSRQKIVSEFTSDNMVAQYDKLYKKIIADFKTQEL